MNQLQQWFKTLVARIKGSHSVDAALADFHKAVAKLENVQALHADIASMHDKTAERALQLRNKAYDEEAKAKALVSKWKEFLHV